MSIKKSNSSGNRIEKLCYISKFIHDEFTAAVELGFIVHDIDLQRWALQAQEEIEIYILYLKHLTVGY